MDPVTEAISNNILLLKFNSVNWLEPAPIIFRLVFWVRSRVDKLLVLQNNSSRETK